MVVWWVVVMLVGLVVPSAGHTATRLGLHVTQQELDIWRGRANGTITGSINGFTYQSIYQNRIKADADAFVAQSHPGDDGFWAGYTGAGCAPNDQSWPAGAGGTPFGRGNGAYLLRSAFVFLLTGTVAYATPVKTELVNLTTVAGLDWTNTSKFCISELQGSPNLEIMPWFYRVILAYDYLNAGGYTGWGAGEKNTVETWLYNGALLWDQAKVYGIQNNTKYPGIFDVPQDMTCSDCPQGPSDGPMYFGAPTLDTVTYYGFFNQFWYVNAVSMAMGIIKNDQTLIDHAKAYFTANIKAGIFDNGAIPDYTRWADCIPTEATECPSSMWAHAGAPAAAMIATADMLARTGDTSLYTLTAATQVLNGSGGTVGLLTVIQLLATLVNGTTTLYGTTSAGEQDTNHKLTWRDFTQPGGSGNNDYYWDFSSMVANMFYVNGAITTAMERTALSTNNSATGCTDNQYGGCFSGSYINWPDLPFMYGNMEGTVDPFDLTSDPVPTIVRVLR